MDPTLSGAGMLQPVKQAAQRTQFMCDCALWLSHRGHASVIKSKSSKHNPESPDARDA